MTLRVRTIILKGHFSVSYMLIMECFQPCSLPLVFSDPEATVSNTAGLRTGEGYYNEVHEAWELPLSSQAHQLCSWFIGKSKPCAQE